MADDFKPGSFYRICDRTGFRVRAEDTVMEWDGTIVDRRVYEPRHPQDLVRGRADKQTVDNPRPQPADLQQIFTGALYSEDSEILQDESDSALFVE